MVFFIVLLFLILLLLLLISVLLLFMFRRLCHVFQKLKKFSFHVVSDRKINKSVAVYPPEPLNDVNPTSFNDYLPHKSRKNQVSTKIDT